jgi:hypothetical protein
MSAEAVAPEWDTAPLRVQLKAFEEAEDGDYEYRIQARWHYPCTWRTWREDIITSFPEPDTLRAEHVIREADYARCCTYYKAFAKSAIRPKTVFYDYHCAGLLTYFDWCEALQSSRGCQYNGRLQSLIELFKRLGRGGPSVFLTFEIQGYDEAIA